MAVTNDCAIVQKHETVFVDIIAYTIAKSVALEQIESRVEVVFDKMEEIISRLDQGKLAVPDAEMAKTAAAILNFKYRSISHIMILDKPDVLGTLKKRTSFIQPWPISLNYSNDTVRSNKNQIHCSTSPRFLPDFPMPNARPAWNGSSSCSLPSKLCCLCMNKCVSSFHPAWSQSCKWYHPTRDRPADVTQSALSCPPDVRPASSPLPAQLPDQALQSAHRGS